MNLKSAVAAVAVLSGLCASALAGDRPDASEAGLRKDIVELQKTIARLTSRLEAMEQRLSKLEKATNGGPTVIITRQDKIERPSRLGERVGQPVEPTTRMRPLGSHLMVDEHGIIWDGGKPVGVWDVNGKDNGH